MPRFPTRDPEILELAQSIAAGLVNSAADFPAPPVAVADIRAALDAAKTALFDVVAARAASEGATVAKQAAIAELSRLMRADLRYAEDAVRYNDAKLTALGWAGKAPRHPVDAPGQARVLEAPTQEENSVTLDWKAPSDGGDVRTYRIERRERDAGDWTLVEVSVPSEITLSEQPRGKALEYRIIAVNRSGEGMPSNTVVVVL